MISNYFIINSKRSATQFLIAKWSRIVIPFCVSKVAEIQVLTKEGRQDNFLREKEIKSIKITRPIGRLTERVSQSSTPPPIKTEAPRQTGPESRVTGRETQVPPAASRRWVPPSLRPQHGLTQEAKNDVIFRKVRGILNKLTPEKFQKLSDDLLEIDLNSTVILNGVIYLIFEKALDEPKYSSMYAQLCKRLSEEAPNFDTSTTNTIHNNHNSTNNLDEINKTNTSSTCTFLRLLLNVCHNKFINRSTYSEIITHNGPLTQDEEEKQHVAKQKMLGNVKFIGELCKLDMLSESITHNCIQKLLYKDNRPNANIQTRCEDLECLCQLIRTCGKNLDTEQGKMLMDQYFEKMAKRSQSQEYPARIRFMLRDVVELRRNNWIPRKVNTTEGPVPIHQLRVDEDIIRPGYTNRPRDLRNNERDGDNWMNRLPLNLQSGFTDMFSSLSVSSSSPIIPQYSGPPNSYNNRDHRDGVGGIGNSIGGSGGVGGNSGSNAGGGAGTGGGGGSGSGGYRNHNNQRNHNNHHNNHQNTYNNYNNRYNKHNIHGNNNSHNNSFTNNMLNNKDLAPRFKRNLINPPQDPVENLQMRPAANSLLFKANMNINKTQLPLSQPRMNSSSNSSNSSSGGGNNSSSNNSGSNVGTGTTLGGISGGMTGSIGSNNSQQISHQHTNQHHHGANDLSANLSQQQIQQQNLQIKIQPPLIPQSGTAVNNLLNKDQLLIKQGSLENNKPSKQNKKDKGPNKEEILKKVATFLSDCLLPQVAENERNIEDIVTSFIDLKIPDKFMKDSLITILNEILDKNDQTHERVIDYLICLKKESKLNNNAILESFKSVIMTMNERESTIPRVTTLIASLLARAVTVKLCNLSDVAGYTENGQHYPLFLLVLQQLHKNLGKQSLSEIFNASKVNLMLSLPEADRTKDRMAEILEDRNLSFLYPLLKVQAELWKQIQVDSNPQQFYKWIKENVDANCCTDPGFITAMMTVLLKFITQETTLAEGIDPTKNPEKPLIEKEKNLLEKYCPVLNAFLINTDLQLIAIYALQVYCYSVDFPKGMLLRWFTALYELNVIEEESFLRWKEDITDVYPGKGKALFQVNTWLTWLQEAESEDEEDDD